MYCMSNTEHTIYATLERGISGMYVTVMPDDMFPTYTTGPITKAVRKHIDLDRLIDEENPTDKIELGKITYPSNNSQIDSSDITITSIVDNIEQKYARAV